MKRRNFVILLIAGIAGIACATTGLNAQQRQTAAQNPTIQQQIRRDLVGRTIVDPTRKHYREKFEVKSINNVSGIEITGRQNSGTVIVYQTRLKLSDNINTYMATADITYKWNGKAWAIEYLQSKSLDIVSTGKYRNCIMVKPEQMYFSERLFLYNNCDVTLLVEGRMLAWIFDKGKRDWKDFAIPVPANGKAEFYYELDVEYQIIRVERP